MYKRDFNHYNQRHELSSLPAPVTLITIFPLILNVVRIIFHPLSYNEATDIGLEFQIVFPNDVAISFDNLVLLY
jgi:hypothetical protein